jgi:hypothetical protein
MRKLLSASLALAMLSTTASAWELPKEMPKEVPKYHHHMMHHMHMYKPPIIKPPIVPTPPPPPPIVTTTPPPTVTTTPAPSKPPPNYSPPRNGNTAGLWIAGGLVGCGTLSLIIGAAYVAHNEHRELTTREANMLVVGCLLPIVGPYLLDREWSRHPKWGK